MVWGVPEFWRQCYCWFMNSGKIGADRWTGGEIEGSTRGPRGPKKRMWWPNKRVSLLFKLVFPEPNDTDSQIGNHLMQGEGGCFSQKTSPSVMDVSLNSWGSSSSFGSPYFHLKLSSNSTRPIRPIGASWKHPRKILQTSWEHLENI